MAKHHNLDITPVPEKVLYVNEPELVDKTIVDTRLQDDTKHLDNVRIYVPLDINRETILRRIRNVYDWYGSPSWKNESEYLSEISGIISQLEIYDQVWFARQGILEMGTVRMQLCWQTRY